MKGEFWFLVLLLATRESSNEQVSVNVTLVSEGDLYCFDADKHFSFSIFYLSNH